MNQQTIRDIKKLSNVKFAHNTKILPPECKLFIARLDKIHEIVKGLK